MSIVQKMVERFDKKAQRSTPNPKPDIPLGTRSVRLIDQDEQFIDFKYLENIGMYPDENIRNIITDEMRRIKRPLLRKAAEPATASGQRSRVIAVTSALSGDGKTFIALNLCFSLALGREHSVVLIDVDVTKQHITELFDMSGKKGLLDALASPDLRLNDITYPTNVPGLFVIPAGQKHTLAAELVASKKMFKFINELNNADPNRLVVFDTPPLLEIAESQVVTLLAGQVVMVVRTGETPQEAVFSSLEMLDSEQAVGVVLNKVYGKRGSEGYYSGYYQS